MRRRLILAALAISAPAVSAPGTAADGAAARLRPGALDYQPKDEDERGLWMLVDEQEREIKDSRFLVTDPALNAYIKSVLCKTVGATKCAAARIYLVRTPYFNASMAPNGMLVVWTGLLLRARNEAELATVLGHEYGHFENQHGLQSFRDIRAKSDAMAWMSFVPYGAGLLGQVSLVGSFFAFTRDMERRADLVSLDYLAASGYDPMAASTIWQHLRGEMDATAKVRKYAGRRDASGSFMSTHPGVDERMTYLKAAAENKVGPFRNGAAEYRAAMQSWWPRLIDDQIKLNDFGATEYLLQELATEGWTPELLYARGELYRTRGNAGDYATAVRFYREAAKSDAALPETWRGLGIALLHVDKDGDARRAFRTYLQKRPDAIDRAMIAKMAQDK